MNRSVLVLFVFVVFLSNGLFAQDRSEIVADRPARGQLNKADETLEDGSFFDWYFYEGHRGETILIELSSSDFDTYLILMDQDENLDQNDDGEGMGTNSSLTYQFDSAETLVILASSYDPHSAGHYTLIVESIDSLSPIDQGGRGLSDQEIINEQLASSDNRLSTGEFYDSYHFTGMEGQHLNIELKSDDFDAYLMLISPDGEQREEDDTDGRPNPSLQQRLSVTGEYEIIVTSYSPKENGHYTLAYSLQNESTRSTATYDLFDPARASETVDGELEPSDPTLSSGEYFETYVFEGQEGDEVNISMASIEFDTYLIVMSPSGIDEGQNDDKGSETTDSEISLRLSETGLYSIIATSLRGDEQGVYTLSATVPVASLPEDTEFTGSLNSLDPTLGNGEYYDKYSFHGERGMELSIRMNSDDVDTYLVLVDPLGNQEENDDGEDMGTNSELSLYLNETGEYTLIATTYDGGEAGNYFIESSAPIRREVVYHDSESTRYVESGYYGLFIGISDYSGTVDDLPDCREDAENLGAAFQDSGIIPEDQQKVIVDSQATYSEVTRSISSFSRQMGANDTLFIFYSGHGGNIETDDINNERDLKDECLYLYDDVLLDDELASLLEDIEGNVVLVFDTCFSEGFAKDVITEPGWWGVFSCEEDMNSQIAEEFEAGGYLSHYFQQAILGAADGSVNNIVDSIITMAELEQFLHASWYGSENGVPSDIHQHLMFKRNGVDPDEELFYLP